jgi:hypothetical protein
MYTFTRQLDVDNVADQGGAYKFHNMESLENGNVHGQLIPIATALLCSHLPSVHPDTLANQEPTYFSCVTLA